MRSNRARQLFELAIQLGDIIVAKVGSLSLSHSLIGSEVVSCVTTSVWVGLRINGA